MTTVMKRITKGVVLKGETTDVTENAEGSLFQNSSELRLKAYIEGAVRQVVTNTQSQVLTNKTIDLDNNNVSNIQTSNLKSSVLNTSTTLASASNTQIPSALAVKTYVDDKTAAQNEASEIGFTPVGTIAATTVQAMGQELDSDIQGHITDTADAHAASAITNTPSGNLAATNQQAVNNELQSDIDTRATTTALTNHTTASANVHGLGVGSSVVGTTDSQILTNKTITGADIRTPIRSDVKQDTKANLTTYALTASNGQLCFATDTKEMFQVVDTLLESVGGGSQGLDTFVQLYADEPVTNWSTGDNATFLGGGTLAGTFARITSGQLNGDASYRYTQAASSLDDYLASPIQTVPVRFRGQTVSASMFYNYDGGNSDIEFLVWDVTNSTRLTTTSQTLIPATSGSIYKVNLLIPASCTQIRVGFQVEIVNSGKILNFDDIEISADTLRYANTVLTQAISLTGSTSFGSTNTNCRRFTTVTRSTGSGLLIYDDSATLGASFTATQSCNVTVSYSDEGDGVPSIIFGPTLNSTSTSGLIGVSQLESGAARQTVTASISLNSGDVIRAVVENASGAVTSTTLAKFSILAVSSNPQIITASESFSTDTAQLTYASSAAYTLSTLANAPVGTFITFTYAINTNTRTQTTTAPTQTTADMNTNGILLYTRTFGNTSTAAQPAVLAIQIGKGLKGVSKGLYKSSGKVTSGEMDLAQISSTVVQGFNQQSYNESTGILVLDSGFNELSSVTIYSHRFSDATLQTSGYVVINASRSPALVGVPQLQQRIATISDVKSNGTGGGTATSGSYQTRTLNTLSDPTGIVTSLASNQWVLSRGEYYIEGSAPAYWCEAHKAKIRNITDSTDVILGSAEYIRSAGGAGNSAQTQTRSTFSGTVVISSSKVFELQHQVTLTVATSGYGLAAGIGDNEVYSIVKITKVRD